MPKQAIPSVVGNVDAMLLSLRDLPLFRIGVSPNKLYDSYALGRPVISTVLAANREIETFSLGVTAPPENPELLAEAILRLSKMTFNERCLMAERAVDLAQSTYSRQTINAKYDSLLREVIAA